MKLHISFFSESRNWNHPCSWMVPLLGHCLFKAPWKACRDVEECCALTECAHYLMNDTRSHSLRDIVAPQTPAPKWLTLTVGSHKLTRQVKGGRQGSLDEMVACCGFYAERDVGHAVWEVTKQAARVSRQLPGSMPASILREWPITQGEDQLIYKLELHVFVANARIWGDQFNVKFFSSRTAPPASTPRKVTTKCPILPVDFAAHDVHNHKRSQQTGHPAPDGWDHTLRHTPRDLRETCILFSVGLFT